jgi:hypothetical protein
MIPRMPEPSPPPDQRPPVPTGGTSSLEGAALGKSARQERDARTWEIVELFYRSSIAFREIFDNYEWRVLHHSYQKGLNRKDLRLAPEDLAGLMDFKALERLRDVFIFRLKEICHAIFRANHRTDVLDLFVSDIFHEISILKEEHYNVQTYAPQYARDSRQLELSYIVDEVHQQFPSKLNHIQHLFARSRERLEELLPSFVNNRILVRSLYLHRDDFVREAYADGIRHFYKLLYPPPGPLEGFLQVGLSFRASGFDAQAQEAFRLAEAELSASREGAQADAGRIRDLEERLSMALGRGDGAERKGS